MYLMVDVGEQMAAYNTHVPGSLMHWHARPTHAHGQRMKCDLKTFTSGAYQWLFGAGRKEIGLESCALQVCRKQGKV